MCCRSNEAKRKPFDLVRIKLKEDRTQETKAGWVFLIFFWWGVLGVWGGLEGVQEVLERVVFSNRQRCGGSGSIHPFVADGSLSGSR